MATLIGIVSKVIGQVFAEASNGTRRALIEGDRLFVGDQLVTGAEGAVAVHLQNGQELTLGRGSSLQMNSQLLAHHVPHVDTAEASAPTQAQLTDVERLQKAIAAGDDPTQTAEATAAGPGTPGAPGGALGGGHSFVLLEEVAGRVDPTIGFPTAGFNGIPEFPLERLAGDADNGGNAAAAPIGADTPDAPGVPDVPDVPDDPEASDSPVTLNGLNVPGGELTVYEKTLTFGTDPDAPALTRTGTFTVSAPDGLQTLTVGGIAIVTAGVAAGFPQSADTWHGSTLTITGYDPATGVVSYSYTLNYDSDHPNADGVNSISENFDVVATDTDGSTATGQINVNIVDDTPNANPDATSVTEGGVVSGNVLWNDVAGADGPLLGGGVVGVRAGSDTSTPVNGGLNTQINGTYGYLTLDAQGNAEYHSYPNGVNGPGATDVFTYTLRDNDGDESTTTITIDVNNSCINNPVTLNGLDACGGELTVYEKTLTFGTDPDAPALTRTGTFTVSAPDGLQTLTVGGIAIVTAGVAAGFPQSADTWHGSTLTITGYDPATGVVSYSYTLNYDSDHPNADGVNSISENFDVVATDTDGSTATGQINVNIVDDTPNANPDATSVTEGGVVSGNVLWNDVAGADGPLLGGGVVGVRAGSDTSTPVNGGLNTQINGTYGYLTLDAQGNAEYHSYPNGVNGPGATDVFTYTLRDNDGDESTTTITIDVNNSCINNPVTLNGLDACGGELTVYEKNLTYGTDPEAPALTQTGTFTVSAPDGLQTLTVGGIAVVTAGVAAGFPQSADTWHGSTLTITGYDPATGVVTYSYTLNYDSDHPNAGGANSISENFDVVAKDVNGSTATGQINVNIVDDTPNANPDATSVTEGGVVSGNVLWNDVAGADGPLLGGGVVGVRAGSDTSTPVNGGLNTQINGTYGYLTLDAQGNAEYHSYPNGVNGPGATDVFTYTLRDNDGDESTTTITIDVNNGCINPVTLNGLDACGGELTVYEKNLTYGTDPEAPALTQTGTFTVSAPDGLQTLTVGGIAVVTAGVAAGFPQSADTWHGSTLTITGYDPATGVVTYSYTLNYDSDHPNAGGANSISENFDVVAKDVNGSTATGQINVNIVDDTPNANPDATSVTEGGVVSGNVLWNDVAGADGPLLGGGVVGVRAGSDTSTPVNGGLNTQINGTYGYLTLDAQGNAEYHSYPNGVNGPGATDVFTYTLRDNDGDESTTTITIDVNNGCINPVTLNGLDACGGELTVYEKNLTYGTDPEAPALTQTGTFTVSAPDGLQTLTVGGIAVVTAGVAAGFPQSADTWHGSTLTITGYDPATGVVTYSYTLNYDSDHPNAGGANSISENFDVVAKDVNGSTATGQINVNIVDDTPNANPDATSVTEGGVVSGNVLWNDVAGADGPLLGGGVVGVRAGSDTSTPVNSGLNTQINGTYGYLTLDAQGNAEYHSNPNAVNGPGATDVFTYTLRDNDGDESTTTITIDVNNGCINASSDNDVTVITNVLSDNVAVPGEALLANDTDPDGDPLTASPTTFNTGWIAKGGDFTGSNQNYSFTGSNAQSVTIARSAFVANTAAMTAVLVVSGALGEVKHNTTHDEDRITVTLKQGETLNLDHNLAAGHVAMEYSVNGGAFIAIGDGQTITAASDGTYQIHITNIDNDGPGHSGKGAENYQLTLTVNYSGAHNITPDYHGTYTVNDHHGGSDSAGVTITYQDGHILIGTAGDDVLVAGTGDNVINAGDGNDVLTAGAGNNELHGGAGNDLLYSGPGNDLLDGGDGIDTASYAHATAGVKVDLSLLGAQNTLGAGTDTLTAIENLTGSDFDDKLTVDNHNNIITGGLGNDVLNGGGGDDLLIGGLGNNTLTGGAGADTFQWLKGNSGHDVVTDFTPGADKLDLSQLLQGENGTAASLDDYLHFKVTGSGDSLVTSIDVSNMAGAAPNQTIDLAGVNLASHYGVTPGAGGVIAGGADTATIINGMLNDHSLKVDTV